jgi:hypothetical protein
MPDQGKQALLSEVSRVEGGMTKVNRAEVDILEVWPNLRELLEPGILYGGPLLEQFYALPGLPMVPSL